MLAARTRILLPALLAILVPCAASAALLNINTATAGEFDALPGIGPSKAAAILQYRSDHGPFASIADIQNVSGIGPSIYADIAPLITVGEAVPADTSAEDVPVSSSTPAASGGSSTYVPPPSALSIDAGPDLSVTIDMPVAFSARVKAANGSTDSAAHVAWSFGDGSSAEGIRVEKTYQFAGTYLVRARAKDGPIEAADDVLVTVVAAKARITEISSAGMTLANDAESPLDLSGWRASVGGSTFRFPEGTEIVAGGSVLFPQAITNLPVEYDAVLAYPNGVIAARYAPAQPEPLATGSTTVQTVRSVSATSLSVPAHVEAIVAPAPTTDVADAGAPLAEVAAADAIEAPATGFFRSSWAYGALGVLVVAGGALLIL